MSCSAFENNLAQNCWQVAGQRRRTAVNTCLRSVKHQLLAPSADCLSLSTTDESLIDHGERVHQLHDYSCSCFDFPPIRKGRLTAFAFTTHMRTISIPLCAFRMHCTSLAHAYTALFSASNLRHLALSHHGHHSYAATCSCHHSRPACSEQQSRERWHQAWWCSTRWVDTLAQTRIAARGCSSAVWFSLLQSYRVAFVLYIKVLTHHNHLISCLKDDISLEVSTFCSALSRPFIASSYPRLEAGYLSSSKNTAGLWKVLDVIADESGHIWNCLEA